MRHRVAGRGLEQGWRDSWHLQGCKYYGDKAQRYMRERSFLTQVIGEVSDRYDWVIIDCPPNLYLYDPERPSRQRLLRGDGDSRPPVNHWLEHPNQESAGNRERLRDLQPLAVESGQPVAELGGIVFVKVRLGGTMITNTHEATMNAIADSPLVGDKVFHRNTTELIGYSEAAENRIPVWEHNSENARRATQKNEYPSITQLVNRLGP